MMERKFTAEEIMKSIAYCYFDNDPNTCDKCPMHPGCKEDRKALEKQTLDLIKQQKAEIERLRSQVNRLKQYDEERDIRLHAKLTETARAEAIKEFAERVKKAMRTGALQRDKTNCAIIDNIVKKMTEEGAE